jgi:hypothetical protein
VGNPDVTSSICLWGAVRAKGDALALLQEVEQEESICPKHHVEDVKKGI